MWAVCSLVVQRCWSRPCSFSLRSRLSLFWCGSFTASMRHGKEGADAAPVLMLCQAMSNLRVRFRHISYGDQGLFIERDLFFKAGMFPDVPLMEDFQFALNLKRLGEPLGMTKHRIRTSARRFPDGEVNRLRVWANMARLRSRYVKGASPEELALAYGNVRECLL